MDSLDMMRRTKPTTFGGKISGETKATATRNETKNSRLTNLLRALRRDGIGTRFVIVDEFELLNREKNPIVLSHDRSIPYYLMSEALMKNK